MERLPEFIANHLFLVSLLIALLMLLAWNLFGDNMSGMRLLPPVEVTRLINHEHAVLVDVRTQEDFTQGHIINAINIPQADLEARQTELDKYREKPLVLYCQTGTVSGRMSRALKHQGFSNVSVLKGGVQAWKSAGMPLARETDA